MANLFSEKPIVKVVMLKGQDGEQIIVDKNTESGLSFWVGTKAEYEAIPEAELIENCIYYITDDTRDDFRTDLNALDTRLDNIYAEFRAKHYMTFSNQDIAAEYQEIFDPISIRCLNKNGFNYISIFASVKSGAILGGTYTLLTHDIFRCENIIANKGIKYINDDEALPFINVSLSISGKLTISIDGQVSGVNFIDCNFMYPAIEYTPQEG